MGRREKNLGRLIEVKKVQDLHVKKQS